MLCPEVWNFDPPPFSVSTKLCKSEEDIFGAIKHQYINHNVTLTLPNTIQLPQNVINASLEDSQYYRINKVPGNELLKKAFLDYFVRKGCLTAISLNEFTEENSLAITPCGKFILSLTKSSFLELGVDCTFDKHTKSPFRKYYVGLDLRSESNESIKRCEQVQKKLSSCSNLKFDIILAWEPESLDVCPSSIAYYFNELGYFVKSCDVSYKHKIHYNVGVPVYNEESEPSELIEWLGAFSLECDISNNVFSTLKLPENNEFFGQVLQLSFTGLITYGRLKTIISQIIKYIKENSHAMWISMTVQGFQDNIINVRNKQLFLCGGDHNCTVIFKLNQPSLIYSFQEKKH